MKLKSLARIAQKMGLLALGLLVPAACAGQANKAETQVLEQRLESETVLSKVSLTEALNEIDRHLAAPAYVVFGLEFAGPEPRIKKLTAPAGQRLRDVLDQLVRETPGFEFKVRGNRLVHFYQKSFRAAATNPLNIKVRKFKAVDANANDILSSPWNFIPELRDRLFKIAAKTGKPSGYGGHQWGSLGGPKLNVTLENVMVRDILDYTAVFLSESPEVPSRMGWLYNHAPEAQDPFNAHRWRALPSPRPRHAGSTQMVPIQATGPLIVVTPLPTMAPPTSATNGRHCGCRATNAILTWRVPQSERWMASAVGSASAGVIVRMVGSCMGRSYRARRI